MTTTKQKTEPTTLKLIVCCPASKFREALAQDLRSHAYHDMGVSSEGAQGLDVLYSKLNKDGKNYQISPSKPWTLLAAETLISSPEKWFFAHELNTRMIDFWLEFEPNVHFLFVYCRPDTISAISSNEPAAGHPQPYESWLRGMNYMADAAQQNPTRVTWARLDNDSGRLSLPNDCSFTLTQELPIKKDESQIAANAALEKMVDLLCFNSTPSLRAMEERISGLYFDGAQLGPSAPSAEQTISISRELSVIRSLASSTSTTSKEAEETLHLAQETAEYFHKKYKDFKNKCVKLQAELEGIREQSKSSDAKPLASNTGNIDQASVGDLKLPEFNQADLHRAQEAWEHWMLRATQAEARLKAGALTEVNTAKLEEQEPSCLEALSGPQEWRWTFPQGLIHWPSPGCALVLNLVSSDSWQIALPHSPWSNQRPGLHKDGTFRISNQNIDLLASILPDSQINLVLEAIELAFKKTGQRAPVVEQVLSKIRDKLVQAAKSGLRIGSVALLAEKFSQPLEQITLALGDVAFRGKHWPKVIFRLGAALVEPNGHAQHLRIEFPPGNPTNDLLEGWFAESLDENGPKYELRFDTSVNAMDMTAWQRLTERDQALILALLSQGGLIANDLYGGPKQCQRSPEFWNERARQMSRVLNYCLALEDKFVPALADEVM